VPKALSRPKVALPISPHGESGRVGPSSSSRLISRKCAQYHGIINRHVRKKASVAYSRHLAIKLALMAKMRWKAAENTQSKYSNK